MTSPRALRGFTTLETGLVAEIAPRLLRAYVQVLRAGDLISICTQSSRASE